MGLFIAKTLGKGRGLSKDNLQRNMVLAEWHRVTTFTIVSKAMPRNVPGCGNVLGYPVNITGLLTNRSPVRLLGHTSGLFQLTLTLLAASSRR